jgi:2-haloacid dehalogenase
MTDIRWVTFDCYGTLIDWRHGIANGIELLFPGRGEELMEVFNRHEPDVQVERPVRRYAEVLTESLRRTALEAGIPLSPDDADVLAATIPYWPTFADTSAELSRLRAAGWRLALLTNCDRDIIGAAQRRLRTPIDAVVTSEDVGAYKPDHAHFRRFAETFDVTPQNWVHVAQSYFHDMVPANALGIPRIWVNRRDEGDDPAIADAVTSDLRHLTETVTDD